MLILFYIFGITKQYIMKQANFDSKMGVLTYFDSRNTQVNVSCYSIIQAKKIIKDSGILHENITISRMGKIYKNIKI